MHQRMHRTGFRGFNDEDFVLFIKTETERGIDLKTVRQTRAALNWAMSGRGVTLNTARVKDAFIIADKTHGKPRVQRAPLTPKLVRRFIDEHNR
jgi:hypothetical protein